MKKVLMFVRPFARESANVKRRPVGETWAKFSSRFTRWRWNVLGAGFFSLVLAPDATRAQECNSDPNPTPAPTMKFDLSNMTFDASNPFVQASFGINGCDGGAGGSGESGDNGSPGQSGGMLTSIGTNLTLVGGVSPGDPLAPTNAAVLSVFGGDGGDGGQGGYTTNADIQGGDGGVGGKGGTIMFTFNGNFVPDPKTGLASVALSLFAGGGHGGDGGDSDDGGIFIKTGGTGGAGGSGGTIELTGSGSIQAAEFGITASAPGGYGGDGGDATTIDQLDDTCAGDGGDGGSGGNASVQWTSGTIVSLDFGIYAGSDAGGGGDGGDAGASISTQGGNAGAGGNAGSASVLLGAGGSVTVNEPAPPSLPGNAIYVSAIGGDGGNGGMAGTALGAGGGSGGAGGVGGTVSATILGSATYNGLTGTGQTSGQALLIQSNGGGGGNGADANALEGEAGGGGFAGAGGSASLTLGDTNSTGVVKTSGNFAHGALVQSVGGGGGDGGNASFGAEGGAGAAGGNGGKVTVDGPNGSIIVNGTSALAILAQSVGGGGGSGGDTNDIAIGASIAIGGNGGLGGNGDTVTLDLGKSVFASTSTLGGAGILAQSIGGSGGAGGSAVSKGIGLISLVIGGDSKGGGNGGALNITSGSLVTTYGDHAGGLQAQSIGGGGGKGGSAFSFIAGIVPVASIAVGGQGGSGGAAGDVTVSNTAQITTYGADSFGVALQSVGGGGGSGGAAAAHAVDISPDKRVPAISIAIAVGGKGGTGNTGGKVDLTNSGLITTAGDAAIGVIAQSIGGGGGTGGDATAASYSGSPEKGLAISISAAVGGSGGSGALGGDVSITNSGLIATLGQDAYGVFSQSIGGGGGTGGGGDATASSSDAKGSFAIATAVGGSGGSGGDSGTVGLTNSGSIVTSGDGADAVFSQSVGGGGGSAGGGVATANGGKLAIAVGVGGKGGVGGDGNTATVANSGNIVTRGTDSIGLSVQSIGGGGGKGGKGGATAGGVSPLSNAQNLFDTLSSGLNFGQTVMNLGDGILQLGQIGENIQATLDELKGIFAQPQAGDPEEGESTQIDVSVSVGGSGGAGGKGGIVMATNTGAISTFGAQSDGIYAQSVGGGGGSGGAASSTSAASDDTPNQAAVAVGGSGAAAGDGGAVTVLNGSGGSVMTEGVAAIGVFAQSVGGGGGEGSLAGTVTGSLKSLGLGIGGNGGAGGTGGTVSVTTGEGGSTIETTGKHGIAIFAQSIGGGGGAVTTMTTDETFDPSKIIVNPQGRLGDIHGFDLDLGGQGGASGDGGAVDLTTMGKITTGGLDAHGIVAQSIGGGGGFAVGGRVNFSSDGGGGAGGGHGDGGTVTLMLEGSTEITTAGDGAYGILAQSIGGGGGIAGDLSSVQSYKTGTVDNIHSNSGDGGAVSINADGTVIATTGMLAPAIFAQSLGGGGGLLSYNQESSSTSDVLARGTAGGKGKGGTVTVSLTNSQVKATGTGSAGILAQSDGTSSSQIMITIDKDSVVEGGVPDSKFEPLFNDAAAIRLLGGTANVITNAGTITGLESGLAILGNTPKSNTTINNTGTITGDVVLVGTDNLVDNQAGGFLSAPTTLNLNGGLLKNSGTLDVGGTGVVGQTTLTGDLDQSGNGTVRIDIDPANQEADLLVVSGHADIVGVVAVNSLSYRKGTTDPVISAAGGINATLALQDSSTIFSHSAVVTANTLAITTDADFGSADRSKSDTQRNLAGYLQRLFDNGTTGFDDGFFNLGGIGTDQAYRDTLDAISGQEIAAVASARYEGSQNFARGAFGNTGLPNDSNSTGDRSFWARANGSVINHDANRGFPSFDWTAGGFDVGALIDLGSNFSLAGAAGYENGRLDAGDGRVEADSDTGQGLVGLRYQNGPWTASGVVDLSYGSVETRRSIPGVGIASASSNVFNSGLHLRAAYRLPIQSFYVEPALELDANYVRVDGFTENGAAPFDLKVDALEDFVFAVTPTVEIGSPLAANGRTFGSVFVGAGVSFLSGNNFEVDARFASLGGLGDGYRSTFKNDDIVGRFTAGLQFALGPRVDLRLQYRGRVSRHQNENGGEARLGFRF